MELIRDFSQMITRLQSLKNRKQVAVVCPNDEHTTYAVNRALKEGIADFLLLVESKFLADAEKIWQSAPDHVCIEVVDSPDIAAARAVALGREKKVDVLMKGLINTDNLLRAVLNKEIGLLPKGNVLTHVTVSHVPQYKKLLVFSDAAVIPRPNLEQFKAMIHYTVEISRCCGVACPKVALLHCTEKINQKFPHTLSYAIVKELARLDEFGRIYIDGPMDVKTACDAQSGNIKGLYSPVIGDADVLIFPNIEAGNTFYKTLTLFVEASMAGLLRGPSCPIVVTSRSDSKLTKYYSLALACLTENYKLKF